MREDSLLAESAAKSSRWARDAFVWDREEEKYVGAFERLVSQEAKPFESESFARRFRSMYAVVYDAFDLIQRHLVVKQTNRAARSGADDNAQRSGDA